MERHLKQWKTRRLSQRMKISFELESFFLSVAIDLKWCQVSLNRFHWDLGIALVDNQRRCFYEGFSYSKWHTFAKMPLSVSGCQEILKNFSGTYVWTSLGQAHQLARGCFVVSGFAWIAELSSKCLFLSLWGRLRSARMAGKEAVSFQKSLGVRGRVFLGSALCNWI